MGAQDARRGDGERADRFGIARATIRRVAKAAGVQGVSPHVFVRHDTNGDGRGVQLSVGEHSSWMARQG
jgi:hypothetical protein